jgi:hypothetical protein
MMVGHMGMASGAKTAEILRAARVSLSGTTQGVADADILPSGASAR